MGFLLDPLLNALLPHPKISQISEGKSAELLPPLPVAENNTWKREENRNERREGLFETYPNIGESKVQLQLN